jgi:hypothetical protein
MPIKGYKRSGVSMLDFINARIAAKEKQITREECTHISRYGTEEELKEAVERMEAAGGYDNLE